MKLLLFLICSFLYTTARCQVTDDLNVTPNPFIKRTLINFSFIAHDTVTIKVYDVIGTTLVTPFTDSIMPSGIYQDSLKMDSFSDGVYFVSLTLGHRKTISKKIIKSNMAGIKEIELENVIKIFPNPAKDKLSIEFNSVENNFDLHLLNMLGQTVYSIKNVQNKHEIDLSNLSTGIYYLKMQNALEQKIIKIIKE